MTSEREKESGTEPKDEKSTFLPHLDFSTLVLPFYTQALVSLGLIKAPGQKTLTENLDLAKRLIDLLELLRDKTQGNLDPEEEKFLEGCLHQLRMHFIEKTKVIKL